MTLDDFFLLHKNKKFPELDGLRAWAIVMVVMAHIGAWIDNIAAESPFQTLTIRMIKFITYYFPFVGSVGGGAGVDLFFLLSGFLIFMTLYSKNISLVSFFSKRFQRLLPVHVILALSFLVPLSFVNIFLNTFFLSEFLSDFPNVIPITWTLSYELLFYVLCSIWFIVLKKMSHVHSWSFFFGFSILLFLSKWFLTGPLESIGIKYVDMNRFMAFIFGVGIAKLYFSHKDKWLQYEIFFRYTFIPGLVMVQIFKYSYNLVFNELAYGMIATSLSYLFLDMGLFMILASQLTSKDSMAKIFFRNRYARILGMISYSMYLFHYTFALPMTKNILSVISAIPTRMLFFIPVSFLITIVFSVVLFHYLEKPYFLHRKSGK
jgi:peptidoglycan/LPS O-acetylase OafA/YrhL